MLIIEILIVIKSKKQEISLNEIKIRKDITNHNILK